MNVNQMLGVTSLSLLVVVLLCAVVVFGLRPAAKYIKFFAAFGSVAMVSSTLICCALYFRLVW
ncbi:MAG: hypothetical protein R3A45_09760 [Bdellovibrionota bacterium]|nr:hypothetical protein [Deltaproteobacteria bacterium]